jgi:hypothetical protein
MQLKPTPLSFCAVLFTIAPALGASSYPPLTDAQKLLALSTFQSVSLAGAVLNSFDSDMLAGVPGQDPLSQKYVQMTSLIKAAIQSGRCELNSVHWTDPNSGLVTQSRLKISGKNCLVYLDEEDQNSPSAGSGSDQDEFSSSDPAFLSINDVSSWSSTNTSKFSQGGSGTILLTMQGKGNLHSQKLGDLSTTSSATSTFTPSGNDGSVQITNDIQFPGFVAELTFVGKNAGGTSQSQYLLNGAQLTQEEIGTYINLPFAPHSKRAKKSFF